MKKYHSLFKILFVGVTMLSFMACSVEDASFTNTEPDYKGWHTADVQVNVTYSSFDGDGEGTRAVSDGWQDGDRIYLLLEDYVGGKVQAYVQYSAATKGWGQIEYDGYKKSITCTTPRKVEAYFFDGTQTVTDKKITFPEHTGIYGCTDGQYVYPEKGTLTVNVSLAPLTGRIRFAGQANFSATLSGIKTYTGFSRETGALTESTSSRPIKVESDGYTKYVYALLSNPSAPTLTITHGSSRFQTELETTTPVLKIGRSGYMNIPTLDSHRGWEHVFAPVTSIYFDRDVLTLGIGKTATLVATVAPSNAINKEISWESSDINVATVSNSGFVTAKAKGTATITVTSKDNPTIKQTCTVNVVNTNGYEYVDLALPSGILWATMNVGATKPEAYGDFYAWGETTTYTSDNYTLNEFFLPYSLTSEYDVACKKWGGDWRMPTEPEFSELYGYCSGEWTNVNGINGYKFTSKKNGKNIFLPAAGYFNAIGSYKDEMDCGYYWTSSLYRQKDIETLHGQAHGVYFWKYSCLGEYLYVCLGLSVRPVCSK